ncbi:MAG: large conductance mechanosensitive channel protein MscL [Oscillospiraceae bacterium]|nr:large conductance mechanosensitive channel protein MscL [Oscillospiraceae bacterium]
MIKEFKEFAISGNMFDMAIGIIIGGMFKGLVESFTKNIVMPIVSIFTGGVDFNKWKITLPSLFEKYEEVEVNGEMVKQKVVNEMTFGTFISEIVSFLILMLVVFLMVKGVNKLRKAAEARKAKEEEKKEEAPPEPTKEEKLLTEIRDLLAEKK